VYLDPAAAVFARSDLAKPGLTGVVPLPAEPEDARHARLQQALDARPFSGPPIREIALGHFFSVSGDPSGAEFFLGRALRRLPRSAPLWRDYGLALERQGRREEARQAYETALRADPGMDAAQGALGALALDDGRIDEAERRLDAAYRGGERGVQVLTARALLFERQGKGRDAADAWGEAILAAPARRPVLLGAARFHVRRQEPDAALLLYGRILSADPGDSTAAFEKASLLEALGRPAESLEVLRAAGERAAARLPGAGPSPGGAAADSAETAGPTRAEDLRLLEMAARLEETAGDKDRARLWRQAAQQAAEKRGS
jgi:tetratricopeptide (TPR) repeat protein